jgi:hypothetical protein
MNAIVAKQNGQVFRIGEIVDGHHLEFLWPAGHNAENEAADSTETIDAYPYTHDLMLLAKQQNPPGFDGMVLAR